MRSSNTKVITSIGGQATIEGILMRGPFKTYLATRECDGSINSEQIDVTNLSDYYPLLKFPILRGIYSFIFSLQLGYKVMNISAQKALTDNSETESKFELWLNDKFGDKVSNIIVGISGMIGIVLAVLLFISFPTYIYNFISNIVPMFVDNNIYRSIFEGLLRIIIFLLYIFLCSRMKDIKRIFQYHGAEHKTIFCYENREELTVENVKKQSRFHPRCGTSFMIIMLIVGIIVGFFIPFSNVFLRSLVKLLCIPIIIGIGYEILKICGKHSNTFTRIISAPGLWMQRLTTSEPDDDMIEVAIEAIKPVIPENGEDIIDICD